MVEQGGGSFKPVEVVISKHLLSHRRRSSATSEASTSPALSAKTADVLHLVHISGHEFNMGLLERVATLVVNRDPADHVHGVALLWHDEIVIGFPT